MMRGGRTREGDMWVRRERGSVQRGCVTAAKQKEDTVKKVQDKEAERVEVRRSWPIKSSFEVFRGSPGERGGRFDFRTGNLRKE